MPDLDITADFSALMDKERLGRKFQNNLRASTIGFACDRRHWYDLTEPHNPPSKTLMSIFRLGHWIEKMGIATLREMNYIVNDEQKSFRLEKPLIMCHIDGMLSKDGPYYPFDIKSMNSYDAVKMTSAEDFLLSKKSHQRNYPVQLLIYLYATNTEYGYLVLINKQTGWPTPVLFSFEEHMSYLDAAFKRAERVYESIKKKEPGERCTDLDLCLSCNWRHLCLPDLKTAPGVKIVDPVDVVPMLKRMDELREDKKEYEQLDKELKNMVKKEGPGEYVAGDWLMRVKEQTRAAYTVKENTFLTTKFVKMV